MNVDSIKNGVVLDHIKAGRGMHIFEVLHLDTLDCPVAIMKNVSSRKMGKKDIIKIDAEIAVDLDTVAYIDPDITVNIIKDSKVEKKRLSLPETLTDVVRCKNPRCISTTEQELPQIFKLTDRKNRVYRCLYCESAVKE